MKIKWYYRRLRDRRSLIFSSFFFVAIRKLSTFITWINSTRTLIIFRTINILLMVRSSIYNFLRDWKKNNCIYNLFFILGMFIDILSKRKSRVCICFFLVFFLVLKFIFFIINHIHKSHRQYASLKIQFTIFVFYFWSKLANS